MSLRRRDYLIAYDIASTRRLRRAHRFLKGRAFALQYSVFLGHLSEPELREVLAGLGRIVNPRVDDVRAYPLGAGVRIESLGAATLPRGIHAWFDHRHAGDPPPAGTSTRPAVDRQHNAAASRPSR